MVKEVEGTFKIGDHSLHTRTWLPDGAVKAKLIFVHGFSDHMGLYKDFGNALAEAGIAVYGFDQRGWGRSVVKPADRGKTGPTARVVEDIAAFVAPHLPSSSSTTPPPQPQLPIFMMGHSMGGGSLLSFASSAAHAGILAQVRGLLLEAPFLGWPAGENPSWLKVAAGRLVGRIFPHRQLMHRIPPENLTRDAKTVARLREDKLCHDLGTLEGMAETLDRTEALCSGKMALLPEVRSLWLGHGTEDLGTSYDASKRWFESRAGAVSDRTFKTYEGWFHQLHAEPGKEEFFADVIGWILERAGDGAAQKTEGADAAVVGSGSKDGAEADAAAATAPAVAAAAAQDKPDAKL